MIVVFSVSISCLSKSGDHSEVKLHVLSSGCATTRCIGQRWLWSSAVGCTSSRQSLLGWTTQSCQHFALWDLNKQQQVLFSGCCYLDDNCIQMIVRQLCIWVRLIFVFGSSQCFGRLKKTIPVLLVMLFMSFSNN